MAGFNLAEFEWSVIELLLPTKVLGVPRVDDRRVLNWILAAADRSAIGGYPDIPSRYEAHMTCMSRFNRWRKAGHSARILQGVSAAYAGDI